MLLLGTAEFMPFLIPPPKQQQEPRCANFFLQPAGSRLKTNPLGILTLTKEQGLLSGSDCVCSEPLPLFACAPYSPGVLWHIMLTYMKFNFPLLTHRKVLLFSEKLHCFQLALPFGLWYVVFLQNL